MKKIALISDGWRRMITYAWVDGIIRRIRELDEDIALYQYNCYGNWSKDALHNTANIIFIICRICQRLMELYWMEAILWMSGKKKRL